LGTDLLSAMATGPGAIGFTPPLTAIDHTFWIQQTGPAAASYRSDFVVVPAQAALSAFGLGAAGAFRRFTRVRTLR